MRHGVAIQHISKAPHNSLTPCQHTVVKQLQACPCNHGASIIIMKRAWHLGAPGLNADTLRAIHYVLLMSAGGCAGLCTAAYPAENACTWVGYTLRFHTA